MYSLIDLNCAQKNDAQQKLDDIQKPVENLQLTLSALTKMGLDFPLESDELAAIFITLHKQIIDIQRAIS